MVPLSLVVGAAGGRRGDEICEFLFKCHEHLDFFSKNYYSASNFWQKEQLRLTIAGFGHFKLVYDMWDRQQSQLCLF